MRENGYLFLFRWNIEFFAVLMLVCLYCLLLLKVTNKGVNCAFLKGCIDVVLHKNTSIAPNEVTKYFYYIKWHAIQTLVSLSNGNLSAGNPLDSKGKTSVMCDAKKVRLKFSEKCLNLILGWKNYVQYGNICFPHLGILWKYEILQKYYLQRGNICFLQFATHDWSNSIILLLLKSFSTRFTRRTTEEKGNLHFFLLLMFVWAIKLLSFYGISNKCTLTFCAICNNVAWHFDLSHWHGFTSVCLHEK